MDCRTFHRNLEDYLEDGLDFAGRFSMDRHAQQCIACGKELANAHRIRQMVSELQPVKAPPGFEASLIDEIGKRKLYARSSALSRFFSYGLGWPSWRKVALASSILAVLAFGIFVSLRPSVSERADAVSALVSEKQDDTAVDAVETESNISESVLQLPPSVPKQVDSHLAMQTPQPAQLQAWELEPGQEAAEAGYMEHLVVGSNGRPVTIQMPMPRKIRMRYGQMSEEYFIQNVSH
jgi:anti-sigma-K factor RskA